MTAMESLLISHRRMSYSGGDGSSIGHHGIAFFSPDGEDLAEGDVPAELKDFFKNHRIQMEDPMMEVEIVAGDNEIEVKMVDKPER